MGQLSLVDKVGIMRTKPEYVRLIGVELCARTACLLPSACSVARVDAAGRVGKGKGKGKAPNHTGKVCPVNRYRLMTSNSDKGDGDYVRLIGVNKRKGKQWDRSRSERSMSG
jgi:hypothetical protein